MLIRTDFILQGVSNPEERLVGFFRTKDGKYLVSVEVFERLRRFGEPFDIITLSEEGRAEGVRVLSAKEDNTSGEGMLVLDTVPIPHSRQTPPEYFGAWALPS